MMYEKYLNQLRIEASLRNLRESTIHTYCYYAGYFLSHVGKPVEELTTEDVRIFLLQRKADGLSSQTVNLYNSSIRFLYRKVFHKYWDNDEIPRMRIDHHLPTILTLEEIHALLEQAKNIKHRAMLATMYSSGLRVSELTHLHYEDISRSNMWIHVREGKSRCDRYTILSEKNLQLLTDYWYQSGKPRSILFPSRATGSYMDITSVNQFLKRYASKAEIKKNVSTHALRHSFAGHLLEAGVERYYIQALLGHRDPKSTEIYLHLSNKALMGVKSPFDVGGEQHE